MAPGTLDLDIALDVRDELSVEAAIMGPAIVGLASPAAQGIHGRRIVAARFEEWLAGHTA